MDTCILCRSSKKDEIQYGDFLKNNKFGVHTYCLYLSSNLPQNGEDDEGLLGFLEADIKKEVKRISLLKCCYCNKMSANIGCCDRKCRRTFHLICGIENNAENQFCHNFRSFCHIHSKNVQQRPSPKEMCFICYESLLSLGTKFNHAKMILTPCCRNGWAHKLCLQKFAKTAGYFFKCPLCNDANVFRGKLPFKGIFIPNQDAAWELEPNAYAELLERPNECAAQRCKNKKGRKSSSNKNPFVMCSTCGSTAIHRQCLSNRKKKFHCTDCAIALGEGDSGRESLNSYENHDDNEDEYIDVCNVSYKQDLEIIERLVATNNTILQNNGVSATQHVDSDSSDEEIVHVTKRNKLNTDSNSQDSAEKKMRLRSNSKDSDLPHGTRRRKARIISDTETSEITSDDEEIKPSCFNIARKIKIINDTETSQNTSDDEEIKPSSFNTARKIKIINDTETSPNTSEDEKIKPSCFNTARKIKIINDTETSQNTSEDEEIKPLCNTIRKGIGSDSDYSEKNKYNFISRKTDIFNDTDKEIHEESSMESSQLVVKNHDNQPIASENVNSKQKNNIFSIKGEFINLPKNEESVTLLKDKKLKRFYNETYKKEEDTGIGLHNSSIITESDDDDPLENFTELVEKQRKNNSSDHLKKSDNKVCESNKCETDRNHVVDKHILKEKVKYVNIKFDRKSSTKENTLDISCIAKRTRRKTFSSYTSGMKNEKKEQENSLNVSCMALRTRHKSMCSEINYGKESPYEMSKVYDKVHESDDGSQMLTDDNDIEYESKLNNNEKIVDGDFEKGEKKDHNRFEVSCIANRTRKRKSFKSNSMHLTNIYQMNNCNSAISKGVDVCSRRICMRHIS